MNKNSVNFENLFQHATYVFGKLLSKEHDSIAINMYKSSIDGDIGLAKEGIIERGLIDDYFDEFRSMEFLSSKLMGLFYKQTYKDTEFFTYTQTLYRKVRDLKAELKEIDRA